MTSTHLAPTTGLLPRKVKKSCTALTKSSQGAALPCPQEKQRGSCTALTEKQRVAALRRKNSNGDTSLRVLESYDPKRLNGCGFILLLLLVSFLSFFFFAALVPRPAFYQLPVGGPDHPARPALGFRYCFRKINKKATDVILFWNLARIPEKKIHQNSQKKLQNSTKKMKKIGNSIIQSRKNVDDFWLKF